MTILALKILHGDAAGKDIAHFETERSSLLAQIRTRTLNGSWFEQVLQLGAVHAALWYAEDALRGYRQKTTEYEEHAVVVLAFRIQDLNDRRAALIEAINKLAGDFIGVEKLT